MVNSTAKIGFFIVLILLIAAALFLFSFTGLTEWLIGSVVFCCIPVIVIFILLSLFSKNKKDGIKTNFKNNFKKIEKVIDGKFSKKPPKKSKVRGADPGS